MRELGIRSARFAPATALALAAGVLSIGDASADMKPQGKLNVEMYGIITRALLYADDGDKHQLFNVDGGSENTRLGFAVSGKLNENWDVGGVLENNLANSNPASSATLGANGESTTDTTTFGIRVAEIALRHKSAGTFTLGQGNAASVDRVAVDVVSGEMATRFDSVAGHHFQGHGIFSADGRYLFTTENHFAKGTGVVGIHDAADGYKRIGELDAHGIGTHDLSFMPDGKTLALANGGILTHPDSSRAKLNLATMRPSLAYVEAASGRLLADYRLADDLHQASIRHMAVNAQGTVVVVFQYEGAKTRLVPLVGIHAGEDAIQLPAAPVAVTAHMRHYCGSVAFDAAGRHFAVTSPRGNFATFWNAAERRYVGALELADVCGAAAAAAGEGGFYLSSGAGGIVEAAPVDSNRRLRPEWLGRVKWDNHLLALGRAQA